jgi:hypothetical protein
MAPQESAGADLDVDYVISYRIPPDCKGKLRQLVAGMSNSSHSEN